MFETLLAIPRAKDKQGLTPIDLADEFGADSLLGILEEDSR
jgi:hypothetical protein